VKLKWIALVTAVLLVLAVAAYAITRMQQSVERPRRVGQSVLDLSVLSRAASLRIEDGERSVTLISADGGWVVREAGGFPADESKMTDFLLGLTDKTVSHRVTTSEDKLAELKLLTPEEADDPASAGTLLVVEDDEGKTVYRLLVGDSRSAEGRTGRYVRFPQEEAGYLVTAEFSVDSEPQAWLQSGILPTDHKTQYRSVTVRPADGGSLVLTRDDAKADWSVEGIPADRLRAGRVNSLVGDVANLELTGLADAGRSAAELGRERTQAVEVAFFDGRVYTLDVGGEAVDEDAHYATARADVSDDAGEDQHQAVRAFNRRFEGRVFALDTADVSRIFVARDELIKQEQQ